MDDLFTMGFTFLQLSKAWLRGDFQEKMLSLNDEVSCYVLVPLVLDVLHVLYHIYINSKSEKY